MLHEHTNAYTDQELLIEVTYNVLKRGLRPGATVVLFNEVGICVFSSISNQEKTWHGKPHNIGLYRSTCHIPKSFLSDGNYSLTVIIWEGSYNLVCREDDVVWFQVTDAGETRADYYGAWAGVVRPLLQWDTEKLS